MPVGYLFNIYLKDIDENSIEPDDWEFLISSNELSDEEVLYLIMHARRKFKYGRPE